MLKVLVIVGTTREGRSGRKVADWYMKQAEAVNSGLDLELLDIADLDLQMFNEPVSPMYGQYSEIQKRLAEKVGAADGFVFVTTEYNHSIPASLKNFIDHLNAEWHHKAVAYVGYGAAGAQRAIEHLIGVMAELRVASVRDQIGINAIWEALDDNGEPKPGYAHGDVSAQLAELKWWVDALKAARA
jgi:NAD(P)H-dependent FMN reductase